MKIAAKQYARALLDSLKEAKPGKESEVVKSFAKLLVSNNQVSKLGEIIRSFQIMWNRQAGVVEAEIVTVHPLDKGIRAEISALVAEKAKGAKVEMKEKISPDILGGVVVRYGDRGIDLSLKRRLREMKEWLKD